MEKAMNERLEAMKTRVRNRDHAKFRQDVIVEADNERYERENLSWHRRMSDCFRMLLAAEKPIILEDEQIVYTRSLGEHIPNPQEPAECRAEREKGNGSVGVGNISVDWEMAVAHGLLKRREIAAASLTRMSDDPEAVEAMTACIETIDAVLDLAKRYADEARRIGRDDLAEILDHVPANTPRTFHEALQSFKFMHAVTWLQPTAHVTLGRFDQYMLPYYEADLAAGRLTEEEAHELLCELFISFNKDNDLYPGVQQGDNGQALMLGGVKRDGSCAVNALTYLVMQVSHDVNMIDPKINLRVNKDTEMDLLIEAAKLTRRGLGFPQYANDDVEIQSLVNAGYALEDARDYVVAACWEFIIPGVAIDVPNINAINFLAAADTSIREGLAEQDDFEGIMERTRAHIAGQVDTYVTSWRKWVLYHPFPWYTVLMTDCLEKGVDANRGGVKYYNCGIHGSGSANGADALAAVKKFVFEEESIERGDLMTALVTNFENDEPLRLKLFNEGPKVGNNDDYVDSILVKLFDDFADACESHKTNINRSTVIRAGTGSAMYYVSLVRCSQDEMMEPVVEGASADGRHRHDFIGCSLAPSPGVKIRGPLSVLQSFSKIDYSRICNGGPITMELSDTVFRDEDSIRKVAMLIREFATLGCQQLQINTLNVETLHEAKAHPERHKNLIVRVWGWSGYFCELDEPYQDHIIGRHMLTM